MELKLIIQIPDINVHVYLHRNDDAISEQLEGLRQKLDAKEAELKTALDQAQK